MTYKYVGKTPIRKEGWEKVSGRSLYVDDLSYPDMLHGHTIRSQVPCGELKDVKFHEGVNWDEFTIVRASDIPGQNVIAFHIDDQPCLVEKEIRHSQEPVLLIAHSDPEQLRKGIELVELVVVEKPACLSIESALNKEQLVWGEDNIMKTIQITKEPEGDALDWELEHEGTYRTSAQEQMYIEPNGMIAHADPGGVMRVEGSLQCPFYVHTAMKKLFAQPDDKIRVVQTETGGAFGGKEEYPSMIACHTALLAWKAKKPVKMVYDRREDLLATTKRHPSKTTVRSRWTKDGRLAELDIRFFIDAGAYATVSPVVLSRGAIHAAGPYRCPKTEVFCQAVATNFSPFGAFRGFGAPQSIFALERHIDEVAKRHGFCPVELRQNNMIRKGEKTSTSQTVEDQVDFSGLLDVALEASDFHAKRREFEKFNQSHKHLKRGMGLATFYHGAGFTGSGEKHLAAVAGIEFDPKLGIQILTASTEMGQGKNTVFCQIAADALKIDYDKVGIAQPDTFEVPNSGPTVASRTAMIVGWLVEKSAQKMRNTLVEKMGLEENATTEAFLKSAADYVKEFGELKCLEQYQPPGSINWDEKSYKGEAYAAYGWAAYIAEVEVDLRTYASKVIRFYAAQDIGKVLHPTLCAGQIEGGVTQAIGYALFEDVVWDKGAMRNASMTNYIIPTSADVADIQVLFTESPTPIGPGGGAKGVGELPMDGPAPAIVNAIYDATGVSVPQIPVTPERLYQSMKGANS